MENYTTKCQSAVKIYHDISNIKRTGSTLEECQQILEEYLRKSNETQVEEQLKTLRTDGQNILDSLQKNYATTYLATDDCIYNIECVRKLYKEIGKIQRLYKINKRDLEQNYKNLFKECFPEVKETFKFHFSLPFLSSTL